MVEKKLKNVFLTAFETHEDVEKMEYGQTKDWDSIGHLRLIALVEKEFCIQLGGEDVWGMNSYQATLGILRNKLSKENDLES